MKSREEIRGLIALLGVCTKKELVQLVVEEGMDNEAYREREIQNAQVLDETRDYVDTLKRRADLIHAISDTVSENALESEQLEAIAAIVWPAPSAVANDPTQVPTKIWTPLGLGLNTAASEALLIQASGLMWNAHWFLKAYEKTSITTGEPLTRQIEMWRDQVNIWRHVTGVEKHETEEMRRDGVNWS